MIVGEWFMIFNKRPNELFKSLRLFYSSIFNQIQTFKIELNFHNLKLFFRNKFFSTVASCLLDFAELTTAAPIATFMQELNEKKTLHAEQLAVALPNLACYLSCLQYEQVSSKNTVLTIKTNWLNINWSLCVLNYKVCGNNYNTQITILIS